MLASLQKQLDTWNPTEPPQGLHPPPPGSRTDRPNPARRAPLAEAWHFVDRMPPLPLMPTGAAANELVSCKFRIEAITTGIRCEASDAGRHNIGYVALAHRRIGRRKRWRGRRGPRWRHPRRPGWTLRAPGATGRRCGRAWMRVVTHERPQHSR